MYNTIQLAERKEAGTLAVLEVAFRYRWVILGLAVLCQCGTSVAAQALAPLAPLFEKDLGLSKTEVGLFSSATYGGAWSVMLVAGTLTDRFGIRRITSLGLAATGTLLLTMSAMSTLLQAAAVMFAVGVARGTAMPGSTKAILEWFPPASRATAMGLKQTGAPLAGILSAATLPALGLALGWRTALATVGVAVIAAGLVTALLYREQPQAGRRMETKGGMRVGVRSVIGNHDLWTVSTIALLFVIAQQSLIMYLALYYKEVVLVPLIPDERTRIVAAGGYLALCQTGGVFGRVFWGMVSDRLFHSRRAEVLALIGILSTLVMVIVANLDPSHPIWLLTAVPLAAGVSSVGWNGVYHALVTETVGRRYAATGVGFSLTMIETGTTVGPPIFGLVVDLTGTYRIAWLFLAVLCVAGSLVAVTLARRMRRD